MSWIASAKFSEATLRLPAPLARVLALADVLERKGEVADSDGFVPERDKTWPPSRHSQGWPSLSELKRPA